MRTQRMRVEMGENTKKRNSMNDDRTNLPNKDKLNERSVVQNAFNGFNVRISTRRSIWPAVCVCIALCDRFFAFIRYLSQYTDGGIGNK